MRLRGAYPPPPADLGDDAPARTLAARLLRTGEPHAIARATVVVAKAKESGPPETPMSHLGVPLTRPEEEAVGVLVVSDHSSRAWSAEDVDGLQDLAAVGAESEMTGGVDGATSPPPPQDGSSSGETGPAEHLRSQASRKVPVGAASPLASELFSEAGDAALVEIIRESIVGSLHLGALHAGDRLPSIRQTARAFSVTPYMVFQAYAELEVEGLVERRERSGVFVASFEVSSPTTLPETGVWLTEVLTQACQHQVKIPLLPDLIRRWTTAVRVRCACVESCFDSRFALSLELSQQFGIEPVVVAAEIAGQELRDLDLVITTAYHAAEVGPMVAETGKPMLIATVNPLILSSSLHHLRKRDLTVICVDPAYGERLRALKGGAYRDRVRIVRADEAAVIASLDRAEAVLLTSAARQQLEQPDFRLVAPMYPSYSIDFARHVSEALVRINLAGLRA